MTVHKFDPAVNRDGDEWWSTFYGRAFRGYQRHEVITDIALQKAGVDHVVHLEGRGQVLVDAKVREEFYPDILIEVWSDKGRKVPGWALKPLRCHYIAYTFPKQGVGYLLPFALLRLAYERHKLAWAAATETAGSGFRIVHADNGNYTTVSVAVPLEKLKHDIASVMTVYFDETFEPFGEAS